MYFPRSGMIIALAVNSATANEAGGGRFRRHRPLRERYRNTTAVDEVFFVVRARPGDRLLGPNGAGKSTTMRMVLGLDTPRLADKRNSIRKASTTAGVGLGEVGAFSVRDLSPERGPRPGHVGALGFWVPRCRKGGPRSCECRVDVDEPAGHEGLCGLGILSLYVVAALDVVVACALHRVFKPVSAGLLECSLQGSATSTAKRVLPTPPGPISVTNRLESTASHTCSSSARHGRESCLAVRRGYPRRMATPAPGAVVVARRRGTGRGQGCGFPARAGLSRGRLRARRPGGHGPRCRPQRFGLARRDRCLTPRIGTATPPLITSNSPKNRTSIPPPYGRPPRLAPEQPPHDGAEVPASAPRQSHLRPWAHAVRNTEASTKGRPMIEARHLTKRYGKTVAVDQPVPAQRPRAFTWARIAGLLVTIVLLTGLTYLGVSSSPGTASVPQGAHAGQLTMHPCTYPTENGAYRADCGTLVVPEDRADPRSRLISLPVTRVLARSSHPLAPIFRLNGGPGVTNMTFPQASRLAAQHDVVMVGYRGVDGSSVLNCPEVTAALENSAELPRQSVAERVLPGLRLVRAAA